MKIYIFLALALVSLSVFGKDSDTNFEHVGRFNATNNIDGVLLNQNEITTFKDGKLSGPSLYIHKRDSDNVCYIAVQLFYQDNVLHGSNIEFYPNGIIKNLVVNISPNTDFFEVINTFPFQSYCYEFYETGKIKGEGWGLIEEDIMMGNSIRVGTWKYYDSNGDVKEVEYPRKIEGIDGRWLF